ncbi:MAG: M42 family metallopeptidase [Eubacteriaceae bacterium]|nr:M42 family metallopeptidase [Eubacteriaceae bacterium]
MAEKKEKERILEPYGDVDLQMMEDFCQAKGVSGQEKEASRVMKRYLEGYVDTIEYDNLGSIIGCKKGEGEGPKVAFFGHLDEVGFYVIKIEEEGYIRLSKAGGMWGHVLLAQEVMITTREGKEIIGMISAPAPHGMPEEVAKRVKDLDELFVDIGVCDKQEAEALGIRKGDMVTPVAAFRVMSNPNYLMAKAWDDRIGGIIATDIVRHLKGEKLKADVYAVGSVQEEVGLRGAKTAAYAVSPDIGIALDVTLANDVPDSKFGEPLGSGVTLTIMDGSAIANRELVYYMEDLCKELGITYIHDIFLRGGTDSGEIHTTKNGIVNMTISIPARSIHSHRGIIHRKDYADTVKLLTEFARRVDWDLVYKFRASNI